ncbi:hypothetical protein C8R44DRAFT_985104 [Mycena epipterygia]|nr:hypothetical protein C8R44DRAFT_985104 [Mycena epipterygia]
MDSAVAMGLELQSLLRTNRPPTAPQMHAIRHLLATGDAELQRLSETVSIISLVLAELELQISERSVPLAALRGASSAIRRFPPEILGHIFIFCRDDSEENYDKSTEGWLTADPTHAPMVLGQICSYWRSVAHGTPRLWNRVCLQAVGGVSQRTAPLVQQLLARSHTLPLYLNLTTPHMYPSVLFSDGNDPLLAIVSDAHLRLKQLHINIYLQEPAYFFALFPHDTFLPVLSSLDLDLTAENGSWDFGSVLDTFQRAPSLRTLSLRTNSEQDNIITTTFPWSQLHHLTLNITLSVVVARDILIQGRELEAYTIDGPLYAEGDDPPLQQTSTLQRLRKLDVNLCEPYGSPLIFQSISLPNLETLSIHARYGVLECPTRVLIALHARSGFRLRHLSLDNVNLTVDDLVALLQCLSALETLDLHSCSCIEDRLFEVFTFHPGRSLPPIRLLQLKVLSLSITITHPFDGDIVAAMVECLSQHLGDGNTSFPILERLELYFFHRLASSNTIGRLTFEDEIEKRLEAVRATGFLVDR